MPYERKSDLPQSVKDSLPDQVAWSAVKEKYEKSGGQWRRKGH